MFRSFILVSTLAFAALASHVGWAENPAPIQPPSQAKAVFEIVVKDATTKPVAGALVRLFSPASGLSQPLHECTSDTQGRCRLSLEVAPESPLVFAVEREGFVAAHRVVKAETGTISMTLDRPAAITGQVVDQDGRPFGGVRLLPIDMTMLKEPERMPVDPPVVNVAANGSFKVPELPSGSYTLILYQDDGPAAASLAEPVPPIEVSSGHETGVVVRVVRHGALAGRVVSTSDLPHEVWVTPVPHDDAGKPSPRFNMSYVDGMRRTCAPAKEFECTYKLDGLKPGNYRLEVEATDYGPFLSGQEQVLPGRTTEAIDLLAPSPVTLTGRVTDSRSEQGAAGAKVAIFFPGVPLAALEAETKEEGRFGPLRVSPGAYEVQVVHPDYLVYADHLSISPTLKHHEVTLRLASGNRVEGVYINRYRVTAPGVEIVAERIDGAGASKLRTTRTDETGHFAFGALPAGIFIVTAMDGIDIPFKRVEVAEGSSTAIIIDAIKDLPPVPPPAPPTQEP